MTAGSGCSKAGPGPPARTKSTGDAPALLRARSGADPPASIPCCGDPSCWRSVLPNAARHSPVLTAPPGLQHEVAPVPKIHAANTGGGRHRETNRTGPRTPRLRDWRCTGPRCYGSVIKSYHSSGQICYYIVLCARCPGRHHDRYCLRALRPVLPVGVSARGTAALPRVRLSS